MRNVCEGLWRRKQEDAGVGGNFSWPRVQRRDRRELKGGGLGCGPGSRKVLAKLMGSPQAKVAHSRSPACPRNGLLSPQTVSNY